VGISSGGERGKGLVAVRREGERGEKKERKGKKGSMGLNFK
jgi:hypothetical protein